MTVLAGRETRPGVTRAGPGKRRGRLAAQTGRYALFRVAELRELAGPEGI